MKKLLLLIAALTSLVGNAVQHNPTVTKITADGEREAVSSPVADSPGRSHVRYAGEQLCHVTPKLTFDADKGISQGDFQYAVPVDGSDVYTYFESHGNVIVPWDIPAGKYDFLFVFLNPDGILLVTKEDVMIDRDTEVEADAAEARVNHIEWQAYLPDGSKPVSDPENGKIATGTTCIVHRKFDGLLGLHSFEVVAKEFKDGSYHDFQKENDIWVNDTDRFSFGQIMCAAQDGAQYYINMPATGCKSQAISNNRNDFGQYEVNKPSNWQDIIGRESPLTYPYNCWDFVWNNEFQLNYNTLWNVPDDKYIDRIFTCADNVKGWKLAIQPVFEVLADIHENNRFGISFPVMSTNGSGYRFQTVRQTGAVDATLGMYNYNSDENRTIVLNPYLALDENENPVFGNTVPIIVFSRPNEEFGYSYVGRCGELRTVDYLNQEFSIRLDGNEVWNSYPDTQLFYFTEDWQPGVAYEKGVWEYEINAENLVVDGLKSRTHCLMHFEDNADFTWPTLTALQFRGNGGTVTERFETRSEGSMIFYGGEWSNFPNYRRGCDCVSPREVRVEYAPYGSDEFTPLEYAEVPDKRFMPGYGNCYEASLAQVSRKSATGWFGLRFTIVDNQGNTQVQTVTPAFRIEEMAGIDTVGADSAVGVSVNGRDIVAPEGSVVYSADGRRVACRNVAPGIYIVSTPGGTAKVSVR